MKKSKNVRRFAPGEMMIPDLDRGPFEKEEEDLARQMIWVHLWRIMVLLEKYKIEF